MTTAYSFSSRLYIGGSWTDGSSDTRVTVRNPATEETVAEVPQASLADVRQAITAARTAFDEGPWPRLKPAGRAAVLLRMAAEMERRLPDLVAVNTAEAGSVRWVAESIQTRVPVAHLRDMAERVIPAFAWDRPMDPTITPRAGISQGLLRREPFGVCALIPAYNFPFFLSMMKLVPALAAGCTVVLKPAPATPLESLLLGDFADAAGLPPGVLNVVTGDADAGRELTTNPMVDLVSFTGSDAVGRTVYAQAAGSLKKVVLELGGKSASIVRADADLDGAVRSALAGITVHAGQGCSLLTRTIVHESVHDELVERVRAGLARVTVGDPAHESTTMGPLISEAQRAKVEKLIRTGEEEGARLVSGGRRPAGLGKGYFVEPTLFTGVDNSMTIARTEFFGPVGVVIPFRTDEEAVRIANDSPYGLAGGVWSADTATAYEIATQIRAGSVSINGGGGGVNPRAAFGGYKQSGLGREWGEFGLDEYLQTKSISWNAR
ncbi:aldehyde dehydrogenase [Amycolatopsis mediterranei S699]|uniref:Aldehyde dehydrogenase n=3 Tax=Amycolatopsis mediterranei TaxID=33910 RepID=A0A9R0P431_AMYMS|nr:aldehyde dehydrogenase family protein [Amycolatopsis mediterranei]ADJ48926.1 putative aldehyde dehydrogenase [Amycolatopsis mediterranei U32]AEK45875.1 aldehyde dehydrogenase [Amycolatopsis mediterranei S699]AFO80635.1 aldehyde dehydrogenase [Amycolatopsis mediterranei S699]AGT87763.1 aldehyde dehydrogenase [Amycolatopsis mediterranei RB]KDU93956.1 aldehyde dehydrogenase [Amycolatopsis mediterranei]